MRTSSHPQGTPRLSTQLSTGLSTALRACRNRPSDQGLHAAALPTDPLPGADAGPHCEWEDSAKYRQAAGPTIGKVDPIGRVRSSLPEVPDGHGHMHTR